MEAKSLELQPGSRSRQQLVLAMIAAVITLAFLVLLTISNNLSIRTLGAARWKGIQRWNYVGAILVIAHGLLYQAVEKRIPAFVASLLMVLAAATIVQLLGFRRRRKQLKQS